jgi:hypothetical protein
MFRVATPGPIKDKKGNTRWPVKVHDPDGNPLVTIACNEDIEANRVADELRALIAAVAAAAT